MTETAANETDKIARSESSGSGRTGPNLSKSDVVLRVEDLQKSFGALVATDHATFDVERGTITGLIGPNGAGKSTIFNQISGYYNPDGGTVKLNAPGNSNSSDTSDSTDSESDEFVDITGMEPYEIAERGLIRTFQTPRKLEGMTVREAMLLGPQNQPGETFHKLFTAPSAVGNSERENLEAVEQILEEFEIDHLARQPATDISGGQMKLVELARAMLAKPDILLLDEPVAGVNPTLANKLKEQIRRLNEQGTTFLLIEHDMDFIMSLADPIIVLDQGSVMTEGTPDQVRSDQRVADAYLGGGGA